MQNAMRRVVITGLGAVTPLAVGVRPTWKRLIDGHCGIVNIKDRDPKFASLPSQVAGVIPPGLRVDGGWHSKEWLQPGDDRKMALFAQYAMASAEEALQDANWLPQSEEDLEATGVYIGSGIGSLDDAYNTAVEFEKGGYKKVSPLFVPRLLINLAAGHISMRYGFKVRVIQSTTACTTGVHAIGDAARMIAFGDADVMVAGGAESCIHPLAVAGFARARSLATGWNDNPQKASRPFDRSRAGFVIGEGAGAVVLEELEHAKARGASIYAEVRGYGLSSDAHHMTAPREDGQGPYLAMKRALKQAGIKPGSVDYVNAHATSTVLGDAAENRAIKTLLLGDDGHMNAGQVNISSTKGAVGHLLGAAGAAETIFTVLALQNNILPPTLNLDQAGDPAADFDCNYVPNTAQDCNVQVALSNSFGFGGTNASICLTKYQNIVVITSIVVASTAAAVSSRFGAFSRVGGIIGSSVSATFLIVLGIMNVFILYKLIKQLREIINSPADSPEPEFQIEGGGCLFRVLKRMFKLIDRPWKMYPLGVMFGLGFDTSSEIALLGISAISASQGTSFWLILLFPVLFTAGMCLLDTTDGALMMALYTSTRLAKDTIAVLYYQAVLTGVTVMVAVVIGVIQFLGMLQGAANLEGGFWDGVEVASDNYDIIGGAICGSFVVFGILSAILYRPWRKHVDAKRNALIRPYDGDEFDMTEPRNAEGTHGEPELIQEAPEPFVRSDRKGDHVV
ncbi:ketoacyl synthase domain-containing protein, partial [Aureobasidium melanogenum]